jgi:ABC-type nitrate/sulfonate/bicarbonate transport system substrate-binding protein
MAAELGLFNKYGVEVQLSREVGWATVRDKIIYGELDAAHAPAGMVFAASFGLGSIAVECVTGLVMNLHGNAITLSEELWEMGVRDGASLAREILRLRGERRFTFGVVYYFSSHNFLLRNWLLSYGVNPDKDVQIVVVPPPQMYPNLKAGNLDGYCAGEPWNSYAVLSKGGWVVATSSELAPMHPEKILMVKRQFADEREDEHLAVIAALKESCEYCDAPENRDHVIETLAQSQFINVPIQALEMSLRGTFDFGHDRKEKIHDFYIFSRYSANEPMRSKAATLLKQMTRSGIISEDEDLSGAEQLFRPDIFHKASQLIPTE